MIATAQLANFKYVQLNESQMFDLKASNSICPELDVPHFKEAKRYHLGIAFRKLLLSETIQDEDS